MDKALEEVVQMDEVAEKMGAPALGFPPELYNTDELWKWVVAADEYYPDKKATFHAFYDDNGHNVEVEIKKEHQVLMVNKTTSFKKGKGKKNFKKDGKVVAASGKSVAGKKPKNGPKPETECYYCKGTDHCKWNGPKYLADKKADNVKGAVE
ncbi:hypothetical protein ZWY2020_052206 [Hordeum vulgare]|nr:hypothetical protein ZWY2020_052206 [Hordeum vulgare]